MESVYIDFLGPLPKTPRDNEHILLMGVHKMGRMCGTSIADSGSHSESGCGLLLFQVRMSAPNILGSRPQF